MTKKSDLQPELLDDFYGEADEHLTATREILVRLENSLGKPIEQADMEELFRRFHSFKGIASIVGLGPAENLAHVAEDLLRHFRQQKKPFTSREWNLLMSAAQGLDQMVAAFKLDKPCPNYQRITQEIDSLLETEDAAKIGRNHGRVAESIEAEGSEGFEESAENGALLWHCQFTPSKELDAKGINVNSVRKRLENAGEIVKVEPKVLGQGIVSFQFILKTKVTPDGIAEWQNEGITAELIESSQPLPGRRDQRASESVLFPFIAPSQVIRADLTKLDELMRIVGDMVVQKSRFEQVIGDWDQGKTKVNGTALKEVNLGFTRALRELREAIMKIRVVPVAEIFARMPFVIRDLAAETGKTVRLSLEGQQTEIDKYLIERLKEPLLHLVRNAFAHGIETPEERLAAGKPEQAAILLKASTISDSVIIQVKDDGRGIDRNAVIRKAKALGIPVPAVLDDNALLAIISAHGFSTRDHADLTSGRGVGMGVVLNTVRELGGSLTLESRLGEGTQFTLRMPLTVAILEAFIVSAGGQNWAVPQHHVSEILKIQATDVHQVGKQEVIAYRDGVLPVTRLTTHYRLRGQARGDYILMVLSSERGKAGLLVESIHGQKEVVVRAMKDPLLRVEGIAGATELGDGKPVLILDTNSLLQGAVRPLQKTEA